MSTLLEAPEDAGIATIVAPEPTSERLVALDVFRGATIAGMLLVNNPGTWSAIYPPLEHAPWSGWTPTDLIFPFFLFIVGITTHLSLRKRAPEEMLPKILRRGLLIVLVGVLLNAFPFFWWGKIAGIDHPTFWQRVLYRAEHLRCAQDVFRADDAGQPVDAGLVVAAAQAGKAIFCEKPLALSLQQTHAALSAVQTAGVVLQVGFMRRALGNVEVSRNARYGYDVWTEVLGTDGAVVVGRQTGAGANPSEIALAATRAWQAGHAVAGGDVGVTATV